MVFPIMFTAFNGKKEYSYLGFYAPSYYKGIDVTENEFTLNELYIKLSDETEIKHTDLSLLNNDTRNMKDIYQALPNGSGITGRQFHEVNLLNGSGSSMTTKWQLATTKKSDGTGNDLADRYDWEEYGPKILFIIQVDKKRLDNITSVTGKYWTGSYENTKRIDNLLVYKTDTNPYRMYNVHDIANNEWTYLGSLDKNLATEAYNINTRIPYETWALFGSSSGYIEDHADLESEGWNVDTDGIEYAVATIADGTDNLALWNANDKRLDLYKTLPSYVSHIKVVGYSYNTYNNIGVSKINIQVKDVSSNVLVETGEQGSHTDYQNFELNFVASSGNTLHIVESSGSGGLLVIQSIHIWGEYSGWRLFQNFGQGNFSDVSNRDVDETYFSINPTLGYRDPKMYYSSDVTEINDYFENRLGLFFKGSRFTITSGNNNNKLRITGEGQNVESRVVGYVRDPNVTEIEIQFSTSNVSSYNTACGLYNNDELVDIIYANDTNIRYTATFVLHDNTGTNYRWELSDNWLKYESAWIHLFSILYKYDTSANIARLNRGNDWKLFQNFSTRGRYNIGRNVDVTHYETGNRTPLSITGTYTEVESYMTNNLGITTLYYPSTGQDRYPKDTTYEFRSNSGDTCFELNITDENVSQVYAKMGVRPTGSGTYLQAELIYNNNTIVETQIIRPDSWLFFTHRVFVFDLNDHDGTNYKIRFTEKGDNNGTTIGFDYIVFRHKQYSDFEEISELNTVYGHITFSDNTPNTIMQDADTIGTSYGLTTSRVNTPLDFDKDFYYRIDTNNQMYLEKGEYPSNTAGYAIDLPIDFSPTHFHSFLVKFMFVDTGTAATGTTTNTLYNAQQILATGSGYSDFNIIAKNVNNGSNMTLTIANNLTNFGSGSTTVGAYNVPLSQPELDKYYYIYVDFKRMVSGGSGDGYPRAYVIKEGGTLHAQFDLDYNITSGDVTYNNFPSTCHFTLADFSFIEWDKTFDTRLYSATYFRETVSNSLDYPTYQEILNIITGT